MCMPTLRSLYVSQFYELCTSGTVDKLHKHLNRKLELSSFEYGLSLSFQQCNDEVFKYLLQNSRNILSEPVETLLPGNLFFQQCVRDSRILLFKWLVEEGTKHSFFTDLSLDNDQIFCRSYRKVDMELVKYLFETAPLHGQSMPNFNNFAFEISVLAETSQKLDILSYLVRNPPILCKQFFDCSFITVNFSSKLDVLDPDLAKDIRFIQSFAESLKAGIVSVDDVIEISKTVAQPTTRHRLF